jgi:hypothetical protein
MLWLNLMFKLLFNFLRSRKQRNKGKKLLDTERKEISGNLESFPKTIDDYRNRFKSSPLGRWNQAVGTFSIVMNEIWEFKTDNTGRMTEIGVFGGEQDEILFEWKEIADFTIACKITKWPYEDNEDEEAGEQSEWTTIRYDFKMVSTDCGELIGLYQVCDNGTFQAGFWHSMTPLTNNDNW